MPSVWHQSNDLEADMSDDLSDAQATEIEQLLSERDRLRAENATLRKIIRDAHYVLIEDELAKGLE